MIIFENAIKLCHRCVWGRGVGDFNSSSISTPNAGPCIWGALELHQEVATSTSEATTATTSNNPQERLDQSSPQKRAVVCSREISKRPRIFDGREKRLEEREARKRKQEENVLEDGEDYDTGVDQSVEGEGGKKKESSNQTTSPTEQREQVPAEVNTDSTPNDSSAQLERVSPTKSLQRDPSNYLASLDASLTDLIPAEELEEMMSEDFLFCGGATFSKGRRDNKGAEENEVNKIKSPKVEGGTGGRRRESTTTSRRRSARLSVHPNLTGSIFIEEQEEPRISSLQQEKVVEESRKSEPRLSVDITAATLTSPSNTVTLVNITAKPSDVNMINMTPTIASPEVVKSAAATPLFSNSIAPLRVVNKAKTKSRLGKEVQQALGDLTNFETKEGRLLKERTAVRTKGTRKGISLVETNSPTERGKKGASKKGKSTEMSKKHQVVLEPKVSKELERSTKVSSEDSSERNSKKEDRPRSGEGSSSRRSRLKIKQNCNRLHIESLAPQNCYGICHCILSPAY